MEAAGNSISKQQLNDKDNTDISKCIDAELYDSTTLVYDNSVNKKFVHARNCNDQNKRDLAICCHLLQNLQKKQPEQTTMFVDDMIQQLSIYKSDFPYAVAVYNDTTYVAFSGTKTFSHVLSDISIIKCNPLSWYKGKIHLGFLNIAKKIDIDQLADVIQQDNSNRIVLCGYSLGGALAQLIGIRIMCSKISQLEKIKVYAIGSPLVGDKIFAQYCSENFVNNFVFIINYNDLVPKILIKYGYQGFGCYYVIQNNMLKEYTYDTLLKTDYSRNVYSGYNVQDHMIHNYSLDIMKYHKTFLDSGTSRQIQQWGVPVMEKISDIKIQSNEIEIKIEGKYLCNISSIDVSTFKLKHVKFKQNNIITIVCENFSSTIILQNIHLRVSYISICNSASTEIILSYCCADMEDSGLLTEQQKNMSGEDVQTVIQRAIFGARFDILDENKRKYVFYLTELERIARNVSVSNHALEIMKVPDTLSIDLDLLRIMTSKHKEYEKRSDDELKDITDKCDEVVDKQIIAAILESRKSSISSVPDQPEQPHKSIEQVNFIDAINSQQLNIVNIYEKTAESRIKIMEYMANTDTTKFACSWLKDIGTSAAFLCSSAAVIVSTVAGGGAVVGGLHFAAMYLCYGSYLAAGSAALIALGGGVTATVIMGISANILEYITTIESNYIKNLKNICKLLSTSETPSSDNIWSIERSIYEKLKIINIDNYERFGNMYKNLPLYIGKSIVYSSFTTEFVDYIKAVYLLHNLRLLAMGSFSIAVVGPTKNGKSTFLRRLGFNSKPDSTDNTKVISAYYKPNNNFKFIDFPGFDDIDNTTRAQFEANNQLANMYIIILDAMRLNTGPQHKFVMDLLLRKTKIPIIILCSKADIMIIDKKTDEHSIRQFNDKMEAFKTTINETRKNIEILVCCMEDETNDPDKLKSFNILNYNKVNEIIFDKLDALNVKVDRTQFPTGYSSTIDY